MNEKAHLFSPVFGAGAEGNTNKDGGFDKIIIYTRNVIIRTHGDYFSQTKAASGLNRSIGCVEILYGL